MGDPKSRADVDINFYVSLFKNVLRDAYACFPEISHTEFDHDVNHVERRVANEGLKFLTVQLPILGKAIEQGLETSQLIVPPGFARKSKGGERWNIPRLFSALFLRTFDCRGALLHEGANSVGVLRQLCYLCYKIQVPFEPSALKQAETKFKALDESLTPIPSDLKCTPAFRYARLILSRLFRDFNPRLITPSHGPGAVAEKFHAREKYNFTVYSREIDQLYPYVHYMTFGILSDTVDQMVRHLELGGVLPPSRVCLVPKDSRGPRIIAAEPALLQYLQQGLGRAVVSLVESHPETKGRVYFTNQQVHRDLAKSASRNRRNATLDLKDASDRVSLELVEALFPEHLLPALRALRSRSAELPSGEVVALKKFAPMGSALCFPIEALTFFALAAGVIWSENRQRRSNPQPVFVYGDDLIVPTRYAEAVISELEKYGVLFNRGKCCIQGEFRESCGMDASRGEDVTPVKLKTLVLEVPSRRSANLVSLNENANAFFDKGYWFTADFLDKYVEKWWGYPIPTTLRNFQGLSRRSSILPMRVVVPSGTPFRYDRNLQVMKLKTLSAEAREEYSQFPSGVCRLGHNLFHGVNQAFDEMVAVPHSAQPKVRWRAV